MRNGGREPFIAPDDVIISLRAIGPYPRRLKP
jgi:hypothetical protein